MNKTPETTAYATASCYREGPLSCPRSSGRIRDLRSSGVRYVQQREGREYSNRTQIFHGNTRACGFCGVVAAGLRAVRAECRRGGEDGIGDCKFCSGVTGPGSWGGGGGRFERISWTGWTRDRKAQFMNLEEEEF